MENKRLGTLAPTVTDGVVLLNAPDSEDVFAQWKGEDEEQARRFG